MRRARQLKLRSSLAGAFLIAPLLVLAGPVSPVCAAPGSAALVVDTGETSYTYCVALPDDQVSGIELIQLAGAQHGLQYRLGYGGGAVCQLQGVGPEGQDCFADHPNFWGYWRGDPSGGWTWSGTGAGSTTVEPGDVEGWSWGSGQDGSSHQQPPVTTYSSVCGAPEPSEEKPASEGDGGSRKKEGASKAEPAAPTATASDSDAAAFAPEGEVKKSRADENKRRKRPRPKSSLSSTLPSPEISAARAQPHAAPASSEESEAAPVVGLAGVGATVLLGAAGFVIAGNRKRRRL